MRTAQQRKASPLPATDHNVCNSRKKEHKGRSTDRYRCGKVIDRSLNPGVKSCMKLHTAGSGFYKNILPHCISIQILRCHDPKICYFHLREVKTLRMIASFPDKTRVLGSGEQSNGFQEDKNLPIVWDTLAVTKRGKVIGQMVTQTETDGFP